MKGSKDVQILREKILTALKENGFKVNPHIRPRGTTKAQLKLVHRKSKEDKIHKHSKFLRENQKLAKEYAVDGSEIDPSEIKLELRQVTPDSTESKLFLWWNLAWWSIPFERPVGRQMRYILWDKGHDAPFGLIGLHSPPLKMAVRDKYLNITKEKLDYWVNMSLHGQRLGALPPYNDLLGGKMVAMALSSNEIRGNYSEKYKNRKTWMKKRIIPSELLFVTTTSAFGKSSVYERVRYNDEHVSEFLGFTAGTGTFFISDQLYKDLVSYLRSIGKNVPIGYGTGPSKKHKYVDMSLKKLGFGGNTTRIKRGFYLFSHVKNLNQVISEKEKPKWHDRPFSKLGDFWINRYAVPRSTRIPTYKDYSFKKIQRKLDLILKH